MKIFKFFSAQRNNMPAAAFKQLFINKKYTEERANKDASINTSEGAYVHKERDVNAEAFG